MKKIFSIPMLILLFLLQWVSAQSIDSHGRYTLSMYAFEREGGGSPISLYQFLRFSTAAKEWNNLSLNVSMRLLTQEHLDHEAFRAYRLSVSASNLFNNLLDLEIGRQFLHAGIPFGSLDGINLTLKPLANLSWQLFGGVESDLFREFKVTKFDEGAVYGSAVTYRKFYNTDAQLSYLQKVRKSTNQWQIIGLNLNNYSLKTVQFLVQAHYDLLNSRLHRLYASARYLPSRKLVITLFAKQQSPQIYGDSYFRIFEVNQYTQAALNANYALTSSYGLSAGAQYFVLEEGSGQRYLFGVNDNHGAINAVYETGDLGDQLSVMFDYGYEIWNDLIISAGVDYTRYRFEEIYDYENLLANTVRLHYNFSKNWKADLEYQWLKNRMSDMDNRLLSHIHFIW